MDYEQAAKLYGLSKEAGLTEPGEVKRVKLKGFTGKRVQEELDKLLSVDVYHSDVVPAGSALKHIRARRSAG